MNQFGGNWTKHKIEILVEYANAYLTIMNAYAQKYNWKLLYFDGFAGSGMIANKLKDESGKQLIFGTELEARKETIGAARRILEIAEPRAFDEYYFVEKNEQNYRDLISSTKEIYTDKTIYVANEDCNKKLLSMSSYLKDRGKSSKVLAYIDPCGMQVNWQSLESLADASIDMWILIPTGMGVNRLLTTSGEISQAWLTKLEKFLGMSKEELKAFFYEEKTVPTLFGEEEKVIMKRDKAIERSGELYRSRLSEIFKYVSESYILRTNHNTVLFHFLMVSNNNTAIKIANEIIKKHVFQ